MLMLFPITHKVKRLLNSTSRYVASAHTVEESDPMCVAVIPFVLASLMRQRKWWVAVEQLRFLTKLSQRTNCISYMYVWYITQSQLYSTKDRAYRWGTGWQSKGCCYLFLLLLIHMGEILTGHIQRPFSELQTCMHHTSLLQEKQNRALYKCVDNVFMCLQVGWAALLQGTHD